MSLAHNLNIVIFLLPLNTQKVKIMQFYPLFVLRRFGPQYELFDTNFVSEFMERNLKS